MIDIRTTIDSTKFDVRACGILYDNDYILVSNESDGSVTLTGGAVKIDESSEQTVIREFKEETGLSIEVDHLVAIIENFFYLGFEKHQQLLFVYKVYLKKDTKQELKPTKSIKQFWKKTTLIDNLKPEILNEVVKTSSNKIHHYILKQ